MVGDAARDPGDGRVDSRQWLCQLRSHPANAPVAASQIRIVSYEFSVEIGRVTCDFSNARFSQGSPKHPLSNPRKTTTKAALPGTPGAEEEQQ